MRAGGGVAHGVALLFFFFKYIITLFHFSTYATLQIQDYFIFVTYLYQTEILDWFPLVFGNFLQVDNYNKNCTYMYMDDIKQNNEPLYFVFGYLWIQRRYRKYHSYPE